MTRVLVVEDEVDIAEVLRDLLELNGYDVLFAHDGAEGLALAAKEQPDVIVSDIMMPKLDGAEMIRRLREKPSTRDIPVIVISATSYGGSSPYLRKPFDMDELLRTIERVTRRR